jgi:alpha-beta hydrolase superfamily lysophospholipase
MATPEPTIVIIHGSWHVPESYEKLISALRKAGYEVHCPRLPTTNLVSSTLLSSNYHCHLAQYDSLLEPTPKCRPLY